MFEAYWCSPRCTYQSTKFFCICNTSFLMFHSLWAKKASSKHEADDDDKEANDGKDKRSPGKYTMKKSQQQASSKKELEHKD